MCGWVDPNRALTLWVSFYPRVCGWVGVKRIDPEDVRFNPRVCGGCLVVAAKRTLFVRMKAEALSNGEISYADH